MQYIKVVKYRAEHVKRNKCDAALDCCLATSPVRICRKLNFLFKFRKQPFPKPSVKVRFIPVYKSSLSSLEIKLCSVKTG